MPNSPAPRLDLKESWFKFFPSDWTGDELLGVCSIGARGLLMELICLMHKAEPYGYLLVNGKTPSDVDLSRLVRVAPGEVKKLKLELLDRGVLSQDDRGVYSRRMVRAAARSTRARAIGALGGNPALKAPQDNPPLRSPLNLTQRDPLNLNANPQKLEARSQRLDPRSQDRGAGVHPATDARSKRPIYSGQRFVVFEWMFDDLRKMLGKNVDDFDLHSWFDKLDREAADGGEVIPQRDRGEWLQAKTLEEAQRRGLTIAVANTKPDPFARPMIAPGTSAADLLREPR